MRKIIQFISFALLCSWGKAFAVEQNANVYPILSPLQEVGAFEQDIPFNGLEYKKWREHFFRKDGSKLIMNTELNQLDKQLEKESIMNFKFNPRQIFIRQTNAERMLKQALDEIPYWNDKLKDENPEEKYLYYLQVDNYWMLIKLYYTVGEDIEKLPPLLEQLIESAEIGTKVWQENKHFLTKEAQNTPPYEWHNALNYLNTLGYISMCYLLQREDLLERLLKVIIDNSVYSELDAAIEDLFYYHLKDRPERDWNKYIHIVKFTDAIRSKGEEQLALLHQYMKDWYKEMVGLNDIEHDTHLTKEQYGYYGYWAFEVAAVIYLEDLDDSSFRDYPYYPKDLVDWAKAKRRERERNKKAD